MIKETLAIETDLKKHMEIRETELEFAEEGGKITFDSSTVEIPSEMILNL